VIKSRAARTARSLHSQWSPHRLGIAMIVEAAELQGKNCVRWVGEPRFFLPGSGGAAPRIGRKAVQRQLASKIHTDSVLARYMVDLRV
jgi:hypothetical protein